MELAAELTETISTVVAGTVMHKLELMGLTADLLKKLIAAVESQIKLPLSSPVDDPFEQLCTAAPESTSHLASKRGRDESAELFASQEPTRPQKRLRQPRESRMQDESKQPQFAWHSNAIHQGYLGPDSQGGIIALYPHESLANSREKDLGDDAHSDTDADMDIDVGTTTKVACFSPSYPYAMWADEPCLSLSTVGAIPTRAFRPQGLLTGSRKTCSQRISAKPERAKLESCRFARNWGSPVAPHQ